MGTGGSRYGPGVLVGGGSASIYSRLMSASWLVAAISRNVLLLGMVARR